MPSMVATFAAALDAHCDCCVVELNAENERDKRLISDAV